MELLQQFFEPSSLTGQILARARMRKVKTNTDAVNVNFLKFIFPAISNAFTIFQRKLINHLIAVFFAID